jgi:4-alpha-glucanotransferase
MRILQYAFGGDARNLDLPHNYVKNCVAYTGTHDNDTTVGWWNSRPASDSTDDGDDVGHEREYCAKYLDTDGSTIHWDFIRAIWSSVADTAIVPLQDVLGLDNEARMNLPASNSGNWHWRFTENSLTDGIKERLKELTEIFGRTR